MAPTPDLPPRLQDALARRERAALALHRAETAVLDCVIELRSTGHLTTKQSYEALNTSKRTLLRRISARRAELARQEAHRTELERRQEAA